MATAMDSPEFQAALKQACDRVWQAWQSGALSTNPRTDGGTTVEAELRSARRKAATTRRRSEAMRRQFDPSLRRIEETLRRVRGVATVGLICPQCGAPDHHNTLNGTPWCVRCHVALVAPEKAKGWVNIRQGSLDAVRRQLRGEP